MASEETVSVIIPVYNVEPYLRECLDSVVAQTYRNLEIIIVDDGSTDGSLAVCREYAGRDRRIKVVTRPNGGLSAARNTGLEHASGEWICFVDSDDVLPRDSIESLLDAALQSGKPIAAGKMMPFCGDKAPDSPENEASGRVEVIPSGCELAQIMLYQTNGRLGVTNSASGKLFHRSVLAGREFQEGILYEDLNLVVALAAESDGAAVVNRSVYFYRTRDDSILGEFDSRRFDVLDVIRGHIARFDNPALEKAASDRLLSAAFNMLMLMARHGYHDEARIAECRSIIKKQRFDSLLNRRVRLRNKGAIVLSYLLGLGFFSIPAVARRFLKR